MDISIFFQKQAKTKSQHQNHDHETKKHHVGSHLEPAQQRCSGAQAVGTPAQSR